ncbi:HK97 family phage prohead protease [Kaustia mangrovi]|uniref:HK97 family phage prohead protease n=1 Tax=Kaustia mangrovi TaxID=2593653 RepID=A0A7S8HBB1_9HYPH|nr:HK97 family phage prohead protease [Kaustia mangrovi]QPC41998.1 HK97 family phage prohead protease [Kaustia mangrovi]
MDGVITPAAPSRARTGRVGRASVDGEGVFEGYASLFGTPDLGGDVVLRGAFQRSLARRPPGAVRMLFQHDPAEPVGVWLAMREDGHGLHVRGRLADGVARARELASLIRAGGVDGLSIGFRTVTARRRSGQALRELAALDLWEISIVTFPLHPGARIAPARPAAPAATLARRMQATAFRLQRELQ